MPPNVASYWKLCPHFPSALTLHICFHCLLPAPFQLLFGPAYRRSIDSTLRSWSQQTCQLFLFCRFIFSLYTHTKTDTHTPLRPYFVLSHPAADAPSSPFISPGDFRHAIATELSLWESIRKDFPPQRPTCNMITGGPANASLRSPHTNNGGGGVGGEQAQAQVAQAVGFFFPSSPILSSSPALYALQTCLGGNLRACFSELLRFRPMWKIGFPPPLSFTHPGYKRHQHATWWGLLPPLLQHGM